MSLDSLLHGKDHDSKYFLSALKPLLPKAKDYVRESFMGEDLKVTAGDLSPGEKSLVAAAFKELANLIVARCANDRDTGLLKRLPGSKGMRAMGINQPYVAGCLEPEYYDAFERYRKFIYSEGDMGEVLYPCWLMGKLARYSRKGYMEEDLKDFVAQPRPEVFRQLSLMGALFKKVLKQAYPTKIPEDVVHTPCFGNISRGMGGASADLYIGGHFVFFTNATETNNLTLINKKAAAVSVLASADSAAFFTNTRDFKGVTAYFARFCVSLSLKKSFFLKDKKAEFLRAQEMVLRRFTPTKVDLTCFAVPKGF